MTGDEKLKTDLEPECSPSDNEHDMSHRSGREVTPSSSAEGEHLHQDLIDWILEVSMDPEAYSTILGKTLAGWKQREFVKYIRLKLNEALILNRETLEKYFDSLLVFDDDVDMKTSDESVIDPDTFGAIEAGEDL